MFYVDSADIDEIEAAAKLGWVVGVTMNPTLIASAGIDDPMRLVATVLERCSGDVLYQPLAGTPARAERETERIASLDPGRVVVKLPARTDWTTFGAGLTARGIRSALTAVYAPAQLLVGAAAGCEAVIPYVDRAHRQLGAEGATLVQRLAAMRSGSRRPKILAASIKSPEQAWQAIRDGADAVTAPLSTLRTLADHPMSDAAIDQFLADAQARPIGVAS